ncbi:MAG: nuclear transport factor 2 family protein [Candidatus Krumholzibacteriota bacterium]|nr:nuclear transport factor 2 family protein [Candidatus Krumholzibacteriota bacterium]
MKNHFVSALSLVVIFMSVASCGLENNGGEVERYKKEIVAAEKAFAAMAREKGVKEAFLAFAADSAVLNRGGRIIKGKKAIEEYFESQGEREVTLSWEPDFTDVSVSGDLGYTFGRYRYEETGQDGDMTVSEGIFHTVWKRQVDGRWLYVWD